NLTRSEMDTSPSTPLETIIPSLNNHLPTRRSSTLKRRRRAHSSLEQWTCSSSEEQLEEEEKEEDAATNVDHRILSLLPFGVLVLRSGSLEALHANAAFCDCLFPSSSSSSSSSSFASFCSPQTSQTPDLEGRTTGSADWAPTVSDPPTCIKDGSWIRRCVHPLDRHALTASLRGITPGKLRYRIKTNASSSDASEQDTYASVSAETVHGRDTSSQPVCIHAFLSPPSTTTQPSPPLTPSTTLLGQQSPTTARRRGLSPFVDRTSNVFLEHLFQRLRDPLSGMAGGALLLEHNLVQRQHLLADAAATACDYAVVAHQLRDYAEHDARRRRPRSRTWTGRRAISSDCGSASEPTLSSGLGVSPPPSETGSVSPPPETFRSVAMAAGLGPAVDDEEMPPARRRRLEESWEYCEDDCDGDCDDDEAEDDDMLTTPPSSHAVAPIAAAAEPLFLGPPDHATMDEARERAASAVREAVSVMWDQLAEDEESLACIQTCVAEVRGLADDVLELSRLDAMVEACAAADSVPSPTPPQPTTTPPCPSSPFDPAVLAGTREAFDPKTLLMDTALEVRAPAQACGVSLRFDLPFDGVPACVGDTARLRAALGRLAVDSVRRASHGCLAGGGGGAAGVGVVTLFLEVLDGAPEGAARFRFGARYDTFLPPVKRAAVPAVAGAAAPPASPNHLDMDLNLLIADRLLSLVGAGTLDFFVRWPNTSPPASDDGRETAPPAPTVPCATPSHPAVPLPPHLTPPASPSLMPCWGPTPHHAVAKANHFPVSNPASVPATPQRVVEPAAPPPPVQQPSWVSSNGTWPAAPAGPSAMADPVTVLVSFLLDAPTLASFSAVPAPVVPAPQPVVSAPAPPTPRYPPTRRALIVEDDVIGQRILERFLQAVGVVSTAAGSVEGCVEAVARSCFPGLEWRAVAGVEAPSTGNCVPTPETPIDTVFMDIQLAGKRTGLEAVKAIRRMEAAAGTGRRVRVIGVSGSSHPRVIREAMEAGMDGFVVKPIRREDVARIVRGEEVGVGVSG
ncbi:hypothetical protein HDU96_002258, partial [Phlyctochytrium bullatum]